jgi:hypothetical protein
VDTGCESKRRAALPRFDRNLNTGGNNHDEQGRRRAQRRITRSIVADYRRCRERAASTAAVAVAQPEIDGRIAGLQDCR